MIYFELEADAQGEERVENWLNGGPSGDNWKLLDAWRDGLCGSRFLFFPYNPCVIN